jgi:hypothetical protein
LAPYTSHALLGFISALETYPSLIRSGTTSTLTLVASIKSVCREHPIPTCRDYGSIKSFKLILSRFASCTVLHYRNRFITNLFNKILEKHKITVPHYDQSFMTSFLIKPHSCDLRSQWLGFNHSVIIEVYVLSSPCFLFSHFSLFALNHFLLLLFLSQWEKFISF